MDETTTGTTQRSGASRRFGYVVAVAVNLVLLFLVNIRPGWDVVPFLTPSFTDVLPLVNLSMWVAVAVNVVTLVHDPPWLVDAGQLVSAVFTVVVGWQLLETFPFDFTAYSIDYAALTRVLLWIAIVGGGIAVVVWLVRLGRDVGRRVATG
ncbi:MAG: hypothetical protein GC157_10005 [Frankiales bacterium]|nr:hypothetical protein [Frankiales bacterium]